MARIKGATMTHKRRKKMLKLAKGFYGCKSKHFKMAKQQVMKSGNYALAGRRMKTLLANELVDGLHLYRCTELALNHTHRSLTRTETWNEIGRASCRERV